MCAGPSILAIPPSSFGGPFRRSPRLHATRPQRFRLRPPAPSGTTPRLTLDFGALFDGEAEVHTHRGPAGRIKDNGKGWVMWIEGREHIVTQAFSLELWGRRMECEVDGENAVAWIGREPWVLLPGWRDAVELRARGNRSWRLETPGTRIGLECAPTAKRIDLWSQPRISVVWGSFLGLAVMKMGELEGWLREREELG